MHQGLNVRNDTFVKISKEFTTIKLAIFMKIHLKIT